MMMMMMRKEEKNKYKKARWSSPPRKSWETRQQTRTLLGIIIFFDRVIGTLV